MTKTTADILDAAADRHTPGPWHVEPVCGEDDQQFWSDDWNGKVFCVCHPQTECDASTVVPWINEADARLIAAAPELLEAARAGLLHVEAEIEEREFEKTADEIAGDQFLPMFRERAATLRAAIARATGAA